MASKRLLSTAVLLAALGAASCQPDFHMPRFQANLNDFFDQIAAEITKFFVSAGLDPLELPDLVQSFNVTDWLGIQWHGELGLESGWLTDLSLFQRSGDALISYEDREFNVSVSLAFHDIAISYDYVAQIMDIGPKGVINGKLEDLVVHIEVGGSLCNMTLALKDFQFTDYGRLTIHIEGDILDFIANAILDVVTALFKGPMMEYVEGALRDAIKLLLDSLDVATLVCGGGACRL